MVPVRGINGVNSVYTEILILSLWQETESTIWVSSLLVGICEVADPIADSGGSCGIFNGPYLHLLVNMLKYIIFIWCGT